MKGAYDIVECDIKSYVTEICLEFPEQYEEEVVKLVVQDMVNGGDHFKLKLECDVEITKNWG